MNLSEVVSLLLNVNLLIWIAFPDVADGTRELAGAPLAALLTAGLCMSLYTCFLRWRVDRRYVAALAAALERITSKFKRSTNK